MSPKNGLESTEATFNSSDGVQIKADLYLAHADEHTPFIVLFHQAGWSRGEYIEVAPKLVSLGFNCMAVDLRSGKKVNGIINETARNAVKLGKAYTFADALPDVVASLKFARTHYAKGKLIAWGSSYSAGLVIKAVGVTPALADGLVAFSPGEYFDHGGKPKTWVRDSAAGLTYHPIFITSAAKERSSWTAIYDAIPSKNKEAYLPTTPGNHGSRALWAQFVDSGAYWRALRAFLTQYFLKERGA